MIRLKNVFQLFSKCICETSWRRLGKASWRCLEEVLKASWRRLEDVWTRRIYWFWPRRLEDILKTSFEDVWLIRIYSPSSRRLHQDECLLGNFVCKFWIAIHSWFRFKRVEFTQQSMFVRKKPCAEIESKFDVWFWKVYSLSIPSYRWTFDCAKTAVKLKSLKIVVV